MPGIFFPREGLKWGLGWVGEVLIVYDYQARPHALLKHKGGGGHCLDGTLMYVLVLPGAEAPDRRGARRR